MELTVIALSEQTLAESAAQEPDNGVYLVARTWHGDKVLNLDAHFDRLERSAAALGHPVRLSRREICRAIASHLPRRDGEVRDGRFRVTVVLDEPPRCIVTIEEAVPMPSELRGTGVVCSVRIGAARHDPEVKSTAWMHEREQLAVAGTVPPYEFLLADGNGIILEGATSNFYALVDGEVRTAGEGVLKGIAREIVLDVATGIAPVRLEPVSVDELSRATEAFISSATRGVVPICRIDEVEFGPPGPVTGRIAAAYDSWLETHLEPLSV